MFLDPSSAVWRSRSLDILVAGSPGRRLQCEWSEVRPLAALETPHSVTVSHYDLVRAHVDRSLTSVVTLSYEEINYLRGPLLHSILSSWPPLWRSYLHLQSYSGLALWYIVGRNMTQLIPQQYAMLLIVFLIPNLFSDSPEPTLCALGRRVVAVFSRLQQPSSL